MTINVHHVHVKTRDPRQTMQFYVDNLGATLVAEVGPRGYRVDLHGLAPLQPCQPPQVFAQATFTVTADLEKRLVPYAQGEHVERVVAAHEVLHCRTFLPFGVLAVQKALVEGQQHPFVELDAVELGVRRPGVDRPAHLQLSRPARAAEALDVTARMEIDLSPDAHRVERHADLVQALPGAAPDRE